MIKLIYNIETWLSTHSQDLERFVLFLITGLVGTFIKIYREPNTPKKWRFSRFLSEFVVSLLMAITVYSANTLFFNLPSLFVMVLCVWAGSLSGQLYQNVENLIESIFISIKDFITKKLSLIIFFSLFLFSCHVQRKAISPLPPPAQPPIVYVVDWGEIIPAILPILNLFLPIKF